MAEIKNGFLLDNGKVFIPSANINVFPCSRRGQYSDLESVKQYDPEARLNTERTNRLHTAINGFKDSFIKSFENNTLKFVLAGYWVEVKNFDPEAIATELSGAAGLYAHLSLHPDVSLKAENYYTELLARQLSTTTDTNYLDISYTSGSVKGDFFIGVSFVKAPVTGENNYNLHLFSLFESEWKEVQTSLLPKIEHDTTPDSIKVSGNFTAEGTTWLKSKAQIDGEAALYNKLLVKSGDTTRAEVNSTDVIFNLPVTVNNTLQIKPTGAISPSAKVTGSLEVTNSISTETINVNTLQSVDTLKTDKAEGLLITSTASSPERTLKVDGKTYITDELTVDNKLIADNIVVDSDGTLDVKTITNTNSGDTAIIVNKGLDIAGTVKVDTITNKSTNADGSAKVITMSAPLEITWPNPANDQAASFQVANGKTSLRRLEATELKVATDKLTVTNAAAEFKVPVTITGDTNSIKTPALDVNTITSGSDAIIVDKKLTLGNNTSITSPVANVHSTLNVTNTAKTAKADIDILESDKAAIGDLEVKAGLNDSTGKVTVAGYVNVGGPNTPTTTAGDIVAKNSIFAENHIVAKNTIKAPTIYQTVNSIDKPVPFIDLVEQDNNQWQLQISRVNKVAKAEN